MRVNDRRGRAKVSPAPRPLDTSTQREGVSPLNQYTVSPEVLRSLKAGLPPRRRPAFPKIKPWEERTPRARENLLPRCGPSRRGAGRRASFCRRTRGARRRRPCNGWANISRPYRAAARPGGPTAPKPGGCTGFTSASRSWRTWYGCRGTGKMRDGLAPFLGQRQRFAATIDRIGVKDGWRSAVTVLLKDVALADTGDVVADHLWLRYGPWADELASGLQVGARITFDAVVTR